MPLPYCSGGRMSRTNSFVPPSPVATCVMHCPGLSNACSCAATRALVATAAVRRGRLAGVGFLSAAVYMPAEPSGNERDGAGAAARPTEGTCTVSEPPLVEGVLPGAACAAGAGGGGSAAAGPGARTAAAVVAGWMMSSPPGSASRSMRSRGLPSTCVAWLPPPGAAASGRVTGCARAWRWGALPTGDAAVSASGCIDALLCDSGGGCEKGELTSACKPRPSCP